MAHPQRRTTPHVPPILPTDAGDSSSDTPGGSQSRYGFGGGGVGRKRGSVDYSSATDVDIGYSSAASNTTFVPRPPYPGIHHHAQHYVQPMYHQAPLSPQHVTSAVAASVMVSAASPEYIHATANGINTGAVNGVLVNNITNSAGGVVSPASPPMVQNSAAAQYRRAPSSTPPVALACTECRQRHLKCNAQTPTCKRCREENRTCIYVKSRRGWKGRKRKPSTVSVASATSGGITSGTDATSANEKGSPEEDGYSGEWT